MAEEHRQRDEGAAGMIDRDERGVGDDVERLLAAIVGMRPPTDVGEQARGMAQPPFVGGLVEPGGGHEPVGPFDQLLAMGGRARAQHVELAGGREQRVLVALLGVEHRIQEALAHPEIAARIHLHDLTGVGPDPRLGAWNPLGMDAAQAVYRDLKTFDPQIQAAGALDLAKTLDMTFQQKAAQKYK